LANESRYIGTEQNINSKVKIIFPPNLSVRIPTGNLKTAPDKTGIPSSHPTSTLLHLKILLSTRNAINIPLIVQAENDNIKARVLRNKILYDLKPAFSVFIKLISPCNYQINS